MRRALEPKVKQEFPRCLQCGARCWWHRSYCGECRRDREISTPRKYGQRERGKKSRTVVLAYIRAHPDVAMAEIAEALGLDKVTTQAVLAYWQGEGAITSYASTRQVEVHNLVVSHRATFGNRIIASRACRRWKPVP